MRFIELNLKQGVPSGLRPELGRLVLGVVLSSQIGFGRIGNMMEQPNPSQPNPGLRTDGIPCRGCKLEIVLQLKRVNYVPEKSQYQIGTVGSCYAHLDPPAGGHVGDALPGRLARPGPGQRRHAHRVPEGGHRPDRPSHHRHQLKGNLLGALLLSWSIRRIYHEGHRAFV